MMAFLLIATIFSAISLEAINLCQEKNDEDDKIISNEEQPIQAIIKVEQIDGRSWSIKVYANNTLDEDIKIRTSPISIITLIDGEVNGIYDNVYGREGPLNNFLLGGLVYRFPFKYFHINVVTSHDEILLDEFIFTGKTNRIDRILYLLRNEKLLPRILPEGDYKIYATIIYKYNKNLAPIKAISEEINIHLDAP